MWIYVHNNTSSPFNFLGEYNIKKLDMIRNTRFVYYEIQNKENGNEKYYGIIDIKLNQIIFNSNETFTTFKPFKNNSMLAFTKTKAYRICAVKNTDGCLDECPDGQKLILDAEKGNHCGSDKDQENCDHYLLIPENICIESCNESIYAINGQLPQQCGLCKDLYDDQKYKLFGVKGCLSSQPKNSSPLNKEMMIYECSNGSDLVNGECVFNNYSCHENCKECISPPTEYNQNCIKCSDPNKFLQEGNCIKNCSSGYYSEGQNCSQWHENCETCNKGEEINDNGENNQNCEACKSKFGYLIKAEGYPQNCVKNCPENTTKNEEKKLCVIEDKENGDNYMIWIFVILIIILLLMISLCICKKYLSRKKNNNELINDINTELQENNLMN